MGDPDALRAVGNSLIWVAVAFGLVVVGFFLALLSYRLPGLTSFLQPALVIPFAVSVLVSGATFRLIFDPAPERGTVTAVWTSLFGSSPVWLGPGLVWLVLVSAFGWTWLGYVVSLFRAGLDAIPGRREPHDRCGRCHGLAAAVRVGDSRCSGRSPVW